MLKRLLPLLLLSVISVFAVDVTTCRKDNARTGQNRNEAILTPSKVIAATFGKLFLIPVDGQVDAEPLYVSALTFPGRGTHNTLYVATGHDSIYTFDAGEAAIAVGLYTAGIPDPDLLIRTSGEMRVSNFLLWQIAYAELYGTETRWPDFTRAELPRAILGHRERDRRLGGLGSRAPAPLEAPLVETVGVPTR
jgi:hypothetical protein